MTILHGLYEDYDMVVGLITYQMDENDLEKVQYLLMMHEQRLATKNMNMSNTVHKFDSVATMNVNYAPQLTRNSIVNTSRGGFPNRGG